MQRDGIDKIGECIMYSYMKSSVSLGRFIPEKVICVISNRTKPHGAQLIIMDIDKQTSLVK